MQINSFKGFKVDTVDTTTSDTSGQTSIDSGASQVNEELDSVFAEPTGGETQTQNEWVINDPCATASSGEGAIQILVDYPPSLEEILAGNERAIRYLDVIKDRYVNTKETLITLRDNYMTALPQVSSSEAALLQQKIELVNKAVIKCGQEIEKTLKKMDDSARLFEQEGSVGKDLNGDGYIGRPGSPYALRVVYDDDGKPHYLDANGNKVANPMIDPDYEAKVIDSDALTLISEDEAIGASGDDVEKADLYYKVNELKQSYDGENNKFGTPINIGVPEYLWVKRDGSSLDPASDEETNEGDYVFDPSLWVDGVQKTPENKTDYVQVRVSRVEVFSEEVKDVSSNDGHKLYNTCVVFKDADDNVIMKLRIEGYFGQGPAATATDRGYYVASSTLGISFYDSNRASPVIFDATQYKSTGRHIVDGVWNTLGITPQDKAAANENRAAFEGSQISTTYVEATGDGAASTPQTKTNKHEFDYDGYHERYTTETRGEKDSLHGFKTGVFVSGLRGRLIGSQYNDVFDVPSVNELSDYATEHIPDDAEPISPGDPFHTCIVEGGGGNNIVKAGKGNLLASGVTFAWVRASREDDISIQVPAVSMNLGDDDQTAGSERINANPKNYVDVEGAGTTTLYDTGETESSEHVAFNAGYSGDYYKLSGSIKASNPADHDIVGYEELNSINQASIDADLMDAISEFGSQIEDEIEGIGQDEDDFDASVQWDEEFGYAAEQEAEMDQFFGDMFGDLDEFQGEFTQP